MGKIFENIDEKSMDKRVKGIGFGLAVSSKIIQMIGPIQDFKIETI